MGFCIGSDISVKAYLLSGETWIICLPNMFDKLSVLESPVMMLFLVDKFFKTENNFDCR